MFISATSVLAAAVVFNAASSFAAVVPITDSSAVAREVTPEVEVREVPADLFIAREDFDDDLLSREDIEDDLFARDEVTDVEARGWHKHKAQEPAPLVHDMKKLQHTQPKFLVTGRVKKWHRVHKWKHVYAAAHKACSKNKKDKKAHDKAAHQPVIVTMFKYNMPGKSYTVSNQQQWEKVLKAAKGHPILISTINPASNPPAPNNNKKAAPAKGKRDLEEDLEMFTRDFEDDDMFAREFDDDVYTRSYESIADLD